MTPSPLRRIVVGVDGSPSSERAVRWAVHQGELAGAEVEAVAAWSQPMAYGGYPVLGSGDWEASARSGLGAVLDALGPLGADVRRTLVRGAAAKVLLDAVGPDDLLVVGSHGHGGFTGMLLGSVSQHVVVHAPCPVVVVRHEAR